MKKIIIALAKVYGFNIAYAGPRVGDYQLEDRQFTITFKHAEGLAVAGLPL